MVAQMNLQGMVKELAAHTARLTGSKATRCGWCSTPTASISAGRSSKRSWRRRCAQYFGEPVRLELSVADRALETLARQHESGRATIA